MSEATEYVIRRKIFTLFGAKFHVYDAAGALIGFSKQKAFKLREDIRVYRDESMNDEWLVIQARSVIDFSAAYDVTDPATGQRIGTLRRKGLSSMFRDAWQVLDENGDLVGNIQEDSMLMALVRRFVLNIFPQHFTLKDQHDTLIAEYRTHFNPFVHRMTVNVLPACPLDPAVPLAAGLLLVAIEGRQKG